MEVDDLKELMDAKLELTQIQINHMNERLDKVVSNLKWVLGLMVPVLTVVLNTVISELLKK